LTCPPEGEPGDELDWRGEKGVGHAEERVQA